MPHPPAPVASRVAQAVGALPLPLLLVAAAAGGWASIRLAPAPGPVVAAGPGRAVAALSRAGARARVTEVLDGDTVRVAFDDRRGRAQVTIRYLGVDAPESVHPRKPVQCFGPAASRANHRWVAGRRVRLRFDRQSIDPYGRLLAAVVPDGWQRSVSERLVAEGYARVLTIAPNGSTAATLERLQRRARRRGSGLWSAC